MINLVIEDDLKGLIKAENSPPRFYSWWASIGWTSSIDSDIVDCS